MPTSATRRTSVRHRRIVDVHVLLIDQCRVLLTLRQGTGYADGQWQVPSGHLEDQEHTAECAAREAAEEIGIILDPARLTLAHLIDHRAPDDAAPRLGVFYTATHWTGTPVNAEPHKCGGIGWFPLDRVPTSTVPYHAAAIANVTAGRVHSVFGWA
ncbi:MAG TPA: NUDIX domain-containing protein [Micromonosporaceae bacterium]|nr:NUDIX domain-containing protein [Micromonosporaceae bacterium]